MADGRTELFTLRISSDERAMLQALADLRGLTSSDIVRQLVRQEYAKLFGEQKPIKKR